MGLGFISASSKDCFKNFISDVSMLQQLIGGILRFWIGFIKLVPLFS